MGGEACQNARINTFFENSKHIAKSQGWQRLLQTKQLPRTPPEPNSEKSALTTTQSVLVRHPPISQVQIAWQSGLPEGGLLSPARLGMWRDWVVSNRTWGAGLSTSSDDVDGKSLRFGCGIECSTTCAASAHCQDTQIAGAKAKALEQARQYLPRSAQPSSGRFPKSEDSLKQGLRITNNHV